MWALTRTSATGIPTIQSELKKNGSPRAIIETNDERTFINVFIPTHSGCGTRHNLPPGLYIHGHRKVAIR